MIPKIIILEYKDYAVVDKQTYCSLENMREENYRLRRNNFQLCWTFEAAQRTNVKRLKEETSFLEDKWSELDIDDAVLQEWVAEVQQWPEGVRSEQIEQKDSQTGNVQKKADGLYLSVNQRKHYLYRLTGNLGQTDVAEQTAEKERILVQEMKRHWGSLQRAVGTLEASSLHLQGNAVELLERGRNGLLCLLKRRLREPTQDQDNSRNTDHKLILGEGAIFDDSDEDEHSDEDMCPVAESSDDDCCAF
ncbi:uncharacterized protein ACWYII_007116 isoform 2-T2 [Salvelinus alpinus]